MMFDINKVRTIIAERNATDNEWDDRIEQCWRKLEMALSEDIPGTIHFLLSYCTDDELATISEVMEDLIGETQSIPLIKAYRTAIVLHPHANEKYNLDRNLDVDITMLTDTRAARQLVAWRPSTKDLVRFQAMNKNI